MMILKRILLFCLALGILTSTMLLLGSGQADDFRQTQPGQTSVAEPPNTDSPAQGSQSEDSPHPANTVSDASITDKTADGSSLPVVGDMETLLRLLTERGGMYYGYDWPDDVMFEAFDYDAEVSVPAQGGRDTADAGAPGAENAAGDFSTTNEQVAGVNEGDIVKTDGSYIYVLSQYDGVIRIIRANGFDLETVSTIKLDGLWGSEFYLIGADRLVIVGSEYVPFNVLPVPLNEAAADMDSEIASDYWYDWWYPNDFTSIIIYDIADRANPKEVRSASMAGWSVSTRVIGSVVYLVTNRYCWSYFDYDVYTASMFPYWRDTNATDDYEPIALDRIYYIPETDDCSYMLIGVIDIYGDEPFDPTAYLGAGSDLYMSREAMYITIGRYGNTSEVQPDGRIRYIWREQTDILRFAIDGTDVRYTGKGTVDGSPINQYSMDEYNGYFRIATTDRGVGTYVTVLDAATMEIVGRTEPLAPGERMQSMRFMGDIGYVVTFQNTDPLFTIDLSIPDNPKVLGELKIPGFSQYLHPVGAGLLLGIGRDTQEIFTRDANGVETVIGFKDVGMKVSLFDVTDLLDPKEIAVLALGEGWTEVSYNPRALMCDAARGLYGFTTVRWGARYELNMDALLIHIGDGTLSLAANLPIPGRDISMYDSRLCFIGATLYVVTDLFIQIYDYTDFTLQGTFRF